MISETERLSLRSELDVRVELLNKENQLLLDERKRLKHDHRSKVDQWQNQETEHRKQVSLLREEIALLSKNEEIKEGLYNENQELRERLGELRAQIESLQHECQGLVSQVIIYRQHS